jgi:hypothetical protein
MNHNPSGNSANATHPDQTEVQPESYQLNPSLQQALTCLDIKLEDELTRFRHKLEHRTSDPQLRRTGEETWEQPAVDYDPDAGVLAAELLKPDISSTTIDEDDYEIIPPSGGFIVINGIPTPASSFSAITTVNYAPLTVHGEDISVHHQSLDLNYSPGGQIAPFREEYIASSQELLRQIQAGATTPPDTFTDRTKTATTPTKRQWVTPLKLGSVAAACVVAGAGVYTYLNPTILAPLTATKVGTITATTTNSLGQIIQSPNLAANEFTELNLSTLNTIKIATATPTTSVSTIANPVGTAAAPMAIPFNPVNPQSIVAPAPGVQPKLADSLVKSLLPSNFQAFAKSVQRPTIQPRAR